jgi:pilus assembly protein CpaC
MEHRKWKRWPLGACVVLAALLYEFQGHAQMAIPTEIHVGRAQILSLKQPIVKVSVAAQEIADVEVLSPTQILIFGKSIGTTNLILFDEAGQTSFFDVMVRQAIESKQVLLQVKVAEVETSALRELGINFSTIQHDSSVTFGGGSFAGKASPPTLQGGVGGGGGLPPGLPGVSLAESVAAAVVRFTPNNDAAAVIKALSDKGLVNTLAEPNMVVRSGEKGNFLAGGRFPIPVISTGGGGGLAAVTIQYEEFGVKLNVSPVVYEDGRISLAIDPAEVSSLDFANAVTISGFNIPAIRTRRVQTRVDLLENETLILAGLINQEDSRNISKFPLLGDIPILGALFRSNRFQKKETDLMIFITPKLVQPLAPGTEVAYPGKGEPTKEQLKEFRWIPLIPSAVNPPK